MTSLRSVLWICARYELVLAVRSRWLQLFAVVFAALALAVSGAGYILSGGHGVQDFSRTAVSLVQIVLLLVPLAALVFGGLALTPERGGAELLYSQPVSRGAILLGRMLGVWLALAAAEAIGFGIAGVFMQYQAGPDGLWRYGALVVTAVAITGVFLAIATLLASINAGRRTRVLAAALVVWFITVVMFDVAVLGIASLLRSGSASRLLITATLVNPVDAARTGSLLAIEGTAAFGAASLALLRFTGGAGMAAALVAMSLVVWLVAPLAVAMRALSRADI
ncbi:MAG: ABC transporter permease subunit [Acidobacteriota bacterium]|nr:ABC transporter permease subunit [Acidobacteriota bacterium]